MRLQSTVKKGRNRGPSILSCFQHFNLSTLPALLRLHLDELHTLTFRQCLVILIAHNSAIVDKDIFAGFIYGESVPFWIVEPLNSSGLLLLFLDTNYYLPLITPDTVRAEITVTHIRRRTGILELLRDSVNKRIWK